MNDIERQIKTDFIEFMVILFYTIFIFAFGFFFAFFILSIKSEKNQIKPTEYILPKAPACGGMYAINNKFNF